MDLPTCNRLLADVLLNVILSCESVVILYSVASVVGWFETRKNASSKTMCAQQSGGHFPVWEHVIMCLKIR